MTTRQKLDRSRELRLWIRDIMVPAAGLAAAAMSIPEVRETVNNKVKEIKYHFEKKRMIKKLSKIEYKK